MCQIWWNLLCPITQQSYSKWFIHIDAYHVLIEDYPIDQPLLLNHWFLEIQICKHRRLQCFAKQEETWHVGKLAVKVLTLTKFFFVFYFMNNFWLIALFSTNKKLPQQWMIALFSTNKKLLRQLRIIFGCQMAWRFRSHYHRIRIRVKQWFAFTV